VTTLTNLLKSNPQTKYKEDVSAMIANAKFGMGKYAEARADYQTYLKAFPTGAAVAEIGYRLPLALVFEGKYEEAIKELNDFIVKNPQSPFVPDAKYRLMVCYFAAAVNDKTGKLYNQIIKLSQEFEKGYPGNPVLGDVLALRGDAYDGLDKDDDAAEAYAQAYKQAQNDDSLNYSLFEAIKIWQKHGQWDKINDTLNEFLRQNPDHASSATAKYWIGRSLVKQRKEADAKKFYSKEIKQYMTQPRRDAVELMIRELVQLLAKKKRAVAVPMVTAPTTVGADSATASPTPSTSPAEPPAADPAAAEPAAPKLTPEEELDALIGGEETLKNRTATARLFLAKAMLAGFKNDTKTREGYYEQLGEFEANELSAYLLGQLGEYFINKQNAPAPGTEPEAVNVALEKAERFCKELLASYPKSEFIEMAYIGQGQIALARKNWQVAYQWFKEAIDVAGATMKVKEALFGQAQALMELGKYPEAKKLFETVASTREWRGEATPESIYHLGEIEFRQQRWSEAIAYFQRVFASYQKYPKPAGRAYLQSALAFDKLGKRKEAITTLGELLRNEKMSAADRSKARELLKQWGAND